MKTTQARCPDCNSTACRSKRAQWETGNRSTNRSYTGVSMSMLGKPRLYLGGMSGTSSNGLTQACAPPAPPAQATTYFGRLLAAIGGFIGGFAIIWTIIFTNSQSSGGAELFGVIVGLVCAAYMVSNTLPNMGEKWLVAKGRPWMAAHKQWESEWICSKCMHVWQRNTSTNETGAVH